MREGAKRSGLTRELTMRLSDHAAMDLPAKAYHDAALHVLDTIAAMVSGSTLTAGRLVLDYADRTGGSESQPCHIVSHSMRSDPVTAARINGMLAHCDETDDSHQASLSHPGCAIVPAALAAAEAYPCDGSTFLRAVIVGYEMTARLNLSMAPGFRNTLGSKPSSHAIGGLFGASVATALICRSDSLGFEYVLSYAAQLAAGMTVWLRDREHVLKAFVFGGMPASNGVLAATMVANGLPGLRDTFDDSPNYLDMLSDSVDESVLRASWGEPYAVSETNFKLHPVGSPAQALVQAAERLAQRVDVMKVSRIRLLLPTDSVHVVAHAGSPNLNARYLVASTLIEGRLTFARAHDVKAPYLADCARLIDLTEVRGEASLAGTRGGCVEVEMDSGELERELVAVPIGTSGAPMRDSEVLRKAHALLAPTVGDEKAARVCELAQALTDVDSVAPLMDLLAEGVAP